MSNSPQDPRTPNQRLNKEYEDPHYHDEDEIAPPDDEPRHSNTGQPPPRRKPLYRPRRRFVDD
jgi:hypothetical protein